MLIQLSLADVVLEITSPRDLDLEDRILPFLCAGRAPDVRISFSWDWERLSQPVSQPVGTDLLQNYYRENGLYYCATRGGPKGWVSCAVYREDLREICCFIHEKPFLRLPHSLGLLLRYLPMRQILARFSVLFVHAAAAAVGSGGLLFTAPSGTGKTTQARLWQSCRGAKILCNDRTLLRRRGDQWLFSGYPVDGSDPVSTAARARLSAVVVLRQAPENRIVRLSPSEALVALMGQMVMDNWDSAQRIRITQELLRLYEDLPIYRLSCTPDQRSVEVLEAQLKKDGVTL